MRKVYNIYYGDYRINNNPVTMEEIEKIYSKNFVYKIINNNRKKIELKDTIIRECICI